MRCTNELMISITLIVIGLIPTSVFAEGFDFWLGPKICFVLSLYPLVIIPAILLLLKIIIGLFRSNEDSAPSKGPMVNTDVEAKRARDLHAPIKGLAARQDERFRFIVIEARRLSQKQDSLQKLLNEFENQPNYNENAEYWRVKDEENKVTDELMALESEVIPMNRSEEFGEYVWRNKPIDSL